MRNHVCGVEHFLDLFPSKAKAYQTIAKLRKRRIIKYVGSAQIGAEGRPRDVFYNGRPPESDRLVHEYHLTTFCLLFPDADWKRLLDTDRTYRPDAEMRRPTSEQRHFVELHTGQVRNQERIRERFRCYENCPHEVLWVCLADRDMQKLAGICDQEHMYFSTLDRVTEAPFGSVWMDHNGDMWDLD